MVLAALVIVWAVVLGSYAKDRMASRRRDTVSSFRTQLSTLERTRPGFVGGGAPLHLARQGLRCETARCRRRNALLVLAGLTLTSLLAVIVAPMVVTYLFVVVCVTALAGYVTLLVQRQRIITEQRMKVRRIGSGRPQPIDARRPVMVASSGR